MTAIDSLSRTGVRRIVALHPEGGRSILRTSLASDALAGADDADARFAAYLLDPAGAPLTGDDAWFARSLLVRAIAPGSALPIGDDVAAIVAAPRLVDDNRLSARLLARRFASRADAAVAAATAILEPEPALAAIQFLATQHGPDEDQLHLALLQAGGALAWRPELAGLAGPTTIVDRLLALLERTSPTPILEALAPILGSIGAASAPLREAVLGRLAEMRTRIEGRRAGASFLDEFRALDRPRVLSDEDYFMTLPDRRVAESAARILGRAAAELDGEGFVALQTTVLAGELGATLLPSFLDGLIGAAAIAPLGELAAALIGGADEEPRLLGLRIAAQLPLDACADPIVACLDDHRRHVRARAVRAVAMLDPEIAVPALLARLDDPEPEVCACAARALVELGQHALIEARPMPGELAVGRTRERTAAARAALGSPSVDVAGALLPLVAAEAEGQADGDELPLAVALGTLLRSSADGIRMTAALVREVPETLPYLALALASEDEPVALAPALRSELAAVLDPIIDGGDESGMIALEILSRFSLGDAAMIERIVDAGARTDGGGQQMLTAFANVRCRSKLAAAALAPWLDSHEHLAATVMAAAVAGLVLPDGHRLWGQVRALYALGSVAAAAAHAALVNGVRLRTDDSPTAL